MCLEADMASPFDIARSVVPGFGRAAIVNCPGADASGVGVYLLVWLAVMGKRCSEHGRFYAGVTALLVSGVVERQCSIRYSISGRLQSGRGLVMVSPLIMPDNSLRHLTVANDGFVPTRTALGLTVEQRREVSEERGSRQPILVSCKPRRHSRIKWPCNRSGVDQASVCWTRSIHRARTSELWTCRSGRAMWRGSDEAVPSRQAARFGATVAGNTGISAKTTVADVATVPFETRLTRLLVTGGTS